jgi:hypothetical protein
MDSKMDQMDGKIEGLERKIDAMQGEMNGTLAATLKKLEEGQAA